MSRIPNNAYTKKCHDSGDIRVCIHNKLYRGTLLVLRCKSGDNDLGQHMLHYNKDYTWHFDTNLYASMLFWCWVGWRDHNGKWVQKSFDVFRKSSDFWNNYTTACVTSSVTGLLYPMPSLYKSSTTASVGESILETTMSTYGKNNAFILALVVITISIISSVRCINEIRYAEPPPEYDIWGKRHIHVVNELYPGTPLNIHCKSKNDDLGEHTLANQESFSWHFRDNYWGTTLFWCAMAWKDGNGNWAQEDHDVYKTCLKGEKFVCQVDYTWSARPDGLYLHYDDGTQELWHHWEYGTKRNRGIQESERPPDDIYMRKHHIHVVNDLQPGTPLIVHCKSKYDDLGEHTLDYQEDFSWHFRENFLGSTLFWCFMEWKDGNGNWAYEDHDVFSPRWSLFTSQSDLTWSAQPEGLYLLHKM
ncbi:hypothetical protein GIB67_023547, partial [Kingdonia uniflora]